MNKRMRNEGGRGTQTAQEVEIFCGVDVSRKELTVAIWRSGGAEKVTTVANTAAGHKQLVKRLVGKQKVKARVCVEASGNYSLDVSLALHRDPRIEVSVLNPRLAKNFAASLGRRSKTDPLDAGMLCEYARRMPFKEWKAPSAAMLKLRSITRLIEAYTRMATQEKNRQHAVDASLALPTTVAVTLRRHLRHLAASQHQLKAAALQVVASDPELSRCFRLLKTMRGMGTKSALATLGELALLPETLNARQWVAHCGLDPQHNDSGTSVHQKTRISKKGNRRVRHALYMPALVAVRHNPHLRAFYQRLLGRGKLKLQALTAVMRKMLHAIHAMFAQNQAYDGARLCPLPTPLPAAA